MNLHSQGLPVVEILVNAFSTHRVPTGKSEEKRAHMSLTWRDVKSRYSHARLPHDCFTRFAIIRAFKLLDPLFRSV